MNKRAKYRRDSDLDMCNHIAQELAAYGVPNPRARAFMACMIWIEHARIRTAGRTLNGRHESSPGGDCGTYVDVKELTGRSLLAAILLLARRLAAVSSADLWMCDVMIAPPAGGRQGSVGARTSGGRYGQPTCDKQIAIINAADEGLMRASPTNQDSSPPASR